MNNGKQIGIFCSLWLMSSAWAMDIVTLTTGEMKTGDMQRYADGVFVLNIDTSDIRLGTNDVKRITFSSGQESWFTLTNGQTGVLNLFSYENECFVFQKGPVGQGTIPSQRVKCIEFRPTGLGRTNPSGSFGENDKHASVASPSHSSYNGASPSYGGSQQGTSETRASSSYTTVGGAGGPVWVNGYYRSDGTWVEGHWRDAPDASTYASPSKTSTDRVWVPGYQRPDGTWVVGHWRNASNSVANATGHSTPASSSSGYSYRGGGSVYVRGYYRKDGTYVSGHMRRK